ncbi:MAG: TIGR02996 domain-containing protein [Myxococcota bacterium]
MAKRRVQPDPRRRAELLAAVFARPEDDAPRLVMADWLTEHGDPRGEFIVLQCELARIPPGQQVQRSRALEARVAELHRRYAASWATCLRGLKPRPQYHFHRGFMSSARFRMGAGLARLPALLDAEPVESLELEDLQRDLEGVRAALAHPRFDELTSLKLIAFNVEARLAEVLTAAPTLKRLRTLCFGYFGGDRAAALLADAPNLGALETLMLSYGGVTDAGARSLAQAKALPRLIHLDLSNNLLTDAGALALAEARLPALRSVNVARNGAITSVGLSALDRRFARKS